MATGLQDFGSQDGGDFLSDCMQPVNDEKGNMNDGSEIDSVEYDVDYDVGDAGSLQLGNEDEINSEESASVAMGVKSPENTKKPEKLFQKSVRMNKDIIKFISKRKKYSLELSERLSKIDAEAELIPEKSLIKVTKNPGTRRIKEWNKRCIGTVTGFCKRFDKACFELNESTSCSVHKTLPKLGATLRSTTAACWIEADGKNLAVMTEQKEREHVLKKVREFLKISDEDGFKQSRGKTRSDRGNWGNPPAQYEVANDTKSNPFNSLTDEASSVSVLDESEGDVREEQPSKQLQTTVTIDSDIIKFLMKRKKYSEELKELISRLGAEFYMKSGLGLIVIKKVDPSFIENWVKRCQDTANVFCSCFHNQYFPVDVKIRDSISEFLPTLQKSVSSTGAACWLDAQKQNLILVSSKTELINTVKEVNEFIQKLGIFAQKSFEIEECIFALVKNSLHKLKTDEGLKSCNITLNDKTLVVVCLRNEIESAVAKVEGFLQGIKRDYAFQSRMDRKPSLLSLVSSHRLIDESNTSSVHHNWRSKNDAGATTSRHEGTPQFLGRARPKKKLDPLNVKMNKDIVKFVMNNKDFSDELTDQLEKLNGEIQWKAGFSFVTVVQKSEDVFVSNWSENCKKLVTEFFQRFRRESYDIQKEAQDLVRKGLPDIKKSVNSLGADCWLASKNRWLVLVGLKDKLPSAVKVVESFLQNVKEENEKLQKIVTFVEVSTDHIDYLEHTNFLETVKQSHPGITEAVINEARNRIRFVGSCEEVSAAKQEYKELIEELNVEHLELADEVMKFVSQRAGLEFIEKCLSDREIVSVIQVESKSRVKIVARSAQDCESVKECLCKNICQANIKLPSKNEHIFATKMWYEMSKAIDSKELVDYQIIVENETRREIKLHGATHLVETYKKNIQDFIHSQKIESFTTNIPSGVARFLKEKLSKELEKIQAELKDEQVKIVIDSTGRLEYAGTIKGINESKRRVVDLKGEINTGRKDYTSVGVNKLFFNEDGRRNIKGIEAVSNVIIEAAQDSISEVRESTTAEVDAMRREQAQEKIDVKLVSSVPIDPFDQCNFTTKEGLNVWWKYGNIAQERADVLVNSATADLNHPTMVGRVLNSVGGISFVAACSQHTNIGTGEIATTIGGNLPCNRVIHAVCCGWNPRSTAEQTLRGLLHKLLVECNRLSARSVAMPLVGTGKHRFPEDVVLRVMREEFERFSSAYRHSTLKEIKLVRYDQGNRRKTVQAQVVSDPTSHMPMTSRSSSTAFVPLVAGSAAESVRVQVYARSTEASDSAFVEIDKFIKSHVTTKKVEHEKLADVVVKHWNELKRLANDNGLAITCVNATTVSIEGMLTEVVAAKEKLTELLNRFIEEERRSSQFSYISKNVQWYYTDQRSGGEVAYSPQLNGTIEAARMDDKAKVEIVDLDGLQYDVDLTQMVARNKSGQTRKLTRKLIGSGTELSLPSSWSPQPDNQVVSLISLLQSSPEYLEVVNHFVARGGRADQLCSVERIQNPRLYSAFLAVKKLMRGQGNELRLFHGTNAANTDSINAHNFSRSFAGVNGTAYGNGVYFARDASYSIGYAKRHLSPGTSPKMYIAKVLVGDYAQGASGMKAPPSKNDPNNPGVRYDSVVDHPNNPSMYIIFQDNQCYPEYLLTLR